MAEIFHVVEEALGGTAWIVTFFAWALNKNILILPFVTNTTKKVSRILIKRQRISGTPEENFLARVVITFGLCHSDSNFNATNIYNYEWFSMWINCHTWTSSTPHEAGKSSLTPPHKRLKVASSPEAGGRVCNIRGSVHATNLFCFPELCPCSILLQLSSGAIYFWGIRMHVFMVPFQ